MDIRKEYENQIEELIAACHRCAELGYVTSSGGNLSYRVAENLILITPTKTPKRFMRFEDICAIDNEGNTVFAPEGKKPTGETPFHARIMRLRPDVRAIVHSHPPILTGFACIKSEILSEAILPEPALEVGPMLNVEYATPLSEELSENFDKVICKSNGFLMNNHGVLLCSTNNITEAVEQTEMVEAMAKSVAVAQLFGGCRFLSGKDISELDEVIAVRNLKTPGYGTKLLREIF